MPSSYRSNNYRPDYSSSYYSRSPSPDPYRHRLSDSEPYERGSSWRPPPPTEAPNGWPDRKFIPPSPTTSSRGRGSREDLSRTFEPSDSWKQSHPDRPSRVDQYVFDIKTCFDVLNDSIVPLLLNAALTAVLEITPNVLLTGLGSQGTVVSPHLAMVVIITSLRALSAIPTLRRALTMIAIVLRQKTEGIGIPGLIL